MASISKDPGGKRRILFIAPDGKRKTIRLGKLSQRAAEAIKFRVEQLVAAQLTGHAIDADTSRWLAERPDPLVDKLARVGLIPERKPKAVVTLGTFLADYVKSRIDVSQATKEVWSQVTRNLIDHFGADRGLPSITEGGAEDFKLFLIKEPLASTTVHKRLGFARQFFRMARKHKLIETNPFDDVSSKAVNQQDRQRFVTPEEIEKVLVVCNPTWQMIVALCRYGGLRCPSEVLSLRWDGVDWATDRVVVHSPKTA